MGVVVFPFQSKSKHKADKKWKDSRHSNLIICVFPSVLRHDIFPCSCFSHHSQDSPSHRSHCSGGTGVLVMLTLTNWFVSLFHTLLKVRQSLDILENPSSVPATFLTDNNPSCCSESSINRSAHLTLSHSQLFKASSAAWKEWNLRNTDAQKITAWPKWIENCRKPCDRMWVSPSWVQWWFIAAPCPFPSWGKRKEQHM